MPIEVTVFSEKTGKKIVVGRIRPGKHFSVTDFSTGSQRIISAYCKRSDSGGKIYSFRNGCYREEGGVKWIPIQKYTSKNLVASIADGQSYGLELVAKSKARGILVFTHKESPKKAALSSARVSELA